MRVFLCGVVLLVATSMSSAQDAKPTTQPADDTFVQPQARRAEEIMRARMAQLDAEYAAKKAAVLQHYAESLDESKLAAMRSGDRKEAQNIFDAAQRVLARFQQFLPPGKDPLAGKKLTSYRIKINDFNGAAGVTEIVEVSDSSITITCEDDFGHPAKTLWKGDLQPRQKLKMSAFMATFPLDRLETGYADFQVSDGYQVDFDIQISDGPAKSISVANIHQRDLEGLVDRVNDLLPPKYALSRMSGD